ncbi:MAG: alpha/beta fold hydrolase [Anaerolineae bacterium]
MATLHGMFTPFAGEEHRAFFLNGGQPAALLVHGFPGTPAEMRPLASALHRVDWTTHGLLLPGFGAEIATLSQRKRQQWSAAVLAALRELQHKHHPVVLIGNSMGSALSLTLAAELCSSGEQPPDALMLFAPFCRIEHVLWQMLPIVKRVFPVFQPFRWFKPDFSNSETRKGIRNVRPDADLDDPQVQQAIREFQLPIAMFDELRMVGAAAYKAASQAALPMLVIQGTQDRLVSPKSTRQLIARCGGEVTYREVTAEHDLLKPENAVWAEVEAAVLAFARSIERSEVHAHRA